MLCVLHFIGTKTMEILAIAPKFHESVLLCFQVVKEYDDQLGSGPPCKHGNEKTEYFQLMKFLAKI